MKTTNVTCLVLVTVLAALAGCTPRPDENDCALKAWPQTGWRDDFPPDEESMDEGQEIEKAYEMEKSLPKDQDATEEEPKSSVVQDAEKGL
ncbi:MAG: hypothetical protein ACK5O7_03605 [Holosporales bacterium]